MSPGKNSPGENEACVAGATLAEVLRMLGGGATGAILMALGEGPLRTKELTEQVPGYTPRTIYRYSGKLAELEIVDRDVDPGPPTKVLHTLTDPCGRELYELLDRYAEASLNRLQSGRIDALDWASLSLLADMWEAGMVEDLSCEPRSPTELAQGPHELSYHQVSRRTGLFKAAGLVRELPGPGRRQMLALTERARRAMALVAGIGRWRHHHVIAEDEEGMTATEMATVLRAALPLTHCPEEDETRVRLDVRHEEGEVEDEAKVWAEVAGAGVRTRPEPLGDVDGWVSGQVKDWIPALLDNDPSGLEIGGSPDLVRTCLGRLYDTLWRPPVSPPELVAV